LGDLLARLPGHVHTIVDESYIQFQDVEPEDAVLSLVEAFPRLTVVRSFSKAYGLSGIRAGYAVGAASASSLLAALAPVLGVNALTQATAVQALKVGDPDLQNRREAVIEQRARVMDALGSMPATAPPTQANFVWLRADWMGGNELAARLEDSRVRVAQGESLGDAAYVRATIRDAHSTDRLLWSLREALQAREGTPQR
jgi:histidinol-phosphate aminotransferase